jgi:hypothetical protein
VHLPGDTDAASGVEIINIVTREVLWTGRLEDWPDNDAWVHEDYVGDIDAPELAFDGLPQSLLEVIDDWVTSHEDEARKLLSEA